MSDTEPATKITGWTDRERLVYLFGLIEHSKVTLDYKNAPRPTGRTQGACTIRVHRLKTTLKADLEALHSGQALEEGTPKKTASTPRKRKPSGDGEKGEATPSKRGRRKKVDVDMGVGVGVEAQADDDDEMFKVKSEVQDEELEAEEKM